MEEYKSFYIIENSNLSSAELSLMDSDLINSLKLNTELSWFFFNRLFVKEDQRNPGLGSKLMIQVAEWADNNNYAIFNTVNAYGSMSEDQLILFYKRHGFENYNDEDPRVLIRYPIKSSVSIK